MQIDPLCLFSIAARWIGLGCSACAPEGLVLRSNNRRLEILDYMSQLKYTKARKHR